MVACFSFRRVLLIFLALSAFILLNQITKITSIDLHGGPARTGGLDSKIDQLRTLCERKLETLTPVYLQYCVDYKLDSGGRAALRLKRIHIERAEQVKLEVQALLEAAHGSIPALTTVDEQTETVAAKEEGPCTLAMRMQVAKGGCGMLCKRSEGSSELWELCPAQCKAKQCPELVKHYGICGMKATSPMHHHCEEECVKWAHLVRRCQERDRKWGASDETTASAWHLQQQQERLCSVEACAPRAGGSDTASCAAVASEHTILVAVCSTTVDVDGLVCTEETPAFPPSAWAGSTIRIRIISTITRSSPGLHSFSVDVFGPVALNLAAEPAADDGGGYIALWHTSAHCLTDPDPTVPPGYDCDLGVYKISIVVDFRDCEGYAPKCHRGKRLNEGSQHDCHILGSPFQSQLVLPSVAQPLLQVQTNPSAGRWRLVDCGTRGAPNDRATRSEGNFETFACASSLSTDITNPRNAYMTIATIATEHHNGSIPTDTVLGHHTFRAVPISRIMEHVRCVLSLTVLLY
jgi:hypothetical protein